MNVKAEQINAALEFNPRAKVSRSRRSTQKGENLRTGGK